MLWRARKISHTQKTRSVTTTQPVKLTFLVPQFLTAHLIFTILMLAAEKSKDTFIAPIGIGLSLFVVEIAGVNFSGGSVNPARSFGPCVAGADFPGYFWIYYLGPVLGALLAAGFYHFVKVCCALVNFWGVVRMTMFFCLLFWDHDLLTFLFFFPHSSLTTKMRIPDKTARARTRISTTSLRRAIWRMAGGDRIEKISV